MQTIEDATRPLDLGALYEDLCARIATRYARRFSGCVEAEDLRQELLVAVIENWNALLAYEEAGEHGRIVRALEHAALAFCRVEQDYYQHHSGQALYSADDCKLLLAALFAPGGYRAEEHEPIGRISGTPDAFGALDRVAELADVSAALDKLKPAQRRVLIARFGHAAASWLELAEALDLSEAALRKAVQRSTARVAEILNSGEMSREYTGSRTQQQRDAVARAEVA